MLIPVDNIDLERIYTRTLGAGIRSLAVVSSCRGEGVSSLAISLTHRHLLSGKSTLFVDLNYESTEHLPMLPSDNIETPLAIGRPQLLSSKDEHFAFLGIPAPAKTTGCLKWRDPGILEQQMANWLEEFDAVIVDAGSLKQHKNALMPSERIVAACQSGILVVMAGITTVPMIQHSYKLVKNGGGNLVGCVFNDLFNPSLACELQRETNRIPIYFNQISEKITNWIKTNRLLSIEV